MRNFRRIFIGFLLFSLIGVPLWAEDQKENKALKVQAALRDLKSDDADVRRSAVVALTRLGPDAKEAVQALLKTLKDKDPVIRQNSIDALGEINVPSAELVDALIPLLKDEEHLVRLKAVETLAKCGKFSVKAENPLFEALKDPKPIVRGFAIEAVWKIFPFNKSVQAIIPLLNDPDEHVRLKAKIGLEAAGTPEAKKALELDKKQKSGKK